VFYFQISQPGKKKMKPKRKVKDDDAWLDAAMAEAGLPTSPPAQQFGSGPMNDPPQMMNMGG